MKLLFNVNAAWFFISHRIEIARAARDTGYEVHVSADIESPEEQDQVEREGFRFHRVRLKRGGVNPVGDLVYLRQLKSVMRTVRPDLVHNVTVKPIVYGTIAARWMGISGIVNAVSGLGFAFIGQESRQVVSSLVKSAYRFALRRSDLKVIFQNRDDIEIFVDAGIIDPRQAVLIRGSGVDLDAFAFSEEPVGPPTIVLPARMLRDKGVVEFVEAARLLRSRGTLGEFILAGKIDEANPACLRREELARFQREAGVQWLGHVTDMASLYRRAHIVCLPSYREGLPKALLEACAVGRAIVATDVPGCREAVGHGENGFLVQPRSPKELAEAIGALLEDAALRRKMGAASRKKAEREFDVRAVVRATLDVYKSVIA
jgi:glycosyltransferase involved in cell wall biosynthesis